MPIHAVTRCLILIALLAAPAQAEASDPDVSGLPIGATIEPSGFATILTAPPVPYPDQPPPSDREWMDPETAMQREINANPSEAARQAAVELSQRLQAGEGQNYIGVFIIRDPYPRFAFQFQADAAATLARYTDDSGFVAVEGGAPAAELRLLAVEWNARLAPHRLGGGNVNEFAGVVEVELGVEEDTFWEIADAEGWRLPDRLDLSFSPPPNSIDVDPSLKPLIRIMPRHDRLPGAVNQALSTARVILRDGCFRLATQDPAYDEPLVIFDRDFMLVVDEDGYMALKGSRTDEPFPRIGELMSWAGPRSVDQRDAGVQELRAICGENQIVSVGTPSSAYYTHVRPSMIDRLAHDLGITRQEAWDALKRCWSLADEVGPVSRFRLVSEQCGVPPTYL